MRPRLQAPRESPLPTGRPTHKLNRSEALRARSPRSRGNRNQGLQDRGLRRNRRHRGPFAPTEKPKSPLSGQLAVALSGRGPAGDPLLCADQSSGYGARLAALRLLGPDVEAPSLKTRPSSLDDGAWGQWTALRAQEGADGSLLLGRGRRPGASQERKARRLGQKGAAFASRGASQQPERSGSLPTP